MMGGQGGVGKGTARQSMDGETQEFLPSGLTTTTTNLTFREGRSYVDKERKERRRK